MLQVSSSNSSLNYILLGEIKNLVLKVPIDQAIVAKNFWFSEPSDSQPFNNEGCCKTEDICLKKHLHFNTIGVIAVLAKIQEKYHVEIPYIDHKEKDISLKEIHNFVVCQQK